LFISIFASQTLNWDWLETGFLMFLDEQNPYVKNARARFDTLVELCR
jgi:hypothetical protein